MPRSVSRSSAAFTLIELLLVLILISTMLGVAAPFFVRSIRGHRLSTAARTVVTTARYARSMALLKQSDLEIAFNLDTGHINLVAESASLPRFSRVIKGVTLAHVDVEGSDAPATEGVRTVSYSSTGICTPYSVKIADPAGNHVIVKVDALSSVRTIHYGADSDTGR